MGRLHDLFIESPRLVEDVENQLLLLLSFVNSSRLSFFSLPPPFTVDMHAFDLDEAQLDEELSRPPDPPSPPKENRFVY